MVPLILHPPVNPPKLKETKKSIASEESTKKRQQAESHGSLTINPSERRGEVHNDFRNCLGKQVIKIFLDLYEQHRAQLPGPIFMQENRSNDKMRKTKSAATKMMTYFLGMATAAELDFLNRNKKGILGNIQPTIQTNIGVTTGGSIFTNVDVIKLKFKTNTLEKQLVELGTRLQNLLCFYFRDVCFKKEATMPEQLKCQGREFPIKMKVSNISTYETKTKSKSTKTDLQKHQKMLVLVRLFSHDG